MRLWDFLCFSLVFAPILTGGLWGRVAGMRLEYTQPGGAALFLAIWAWIRWRRRRDVFEKSLLLSLGLRGWCAWRRLLAAHPAAVFLASFSLVTIIWFFAALSRHRGFHSDAADLGIFVNALHNLAATGTPLSSIKGGVSFLADHQMFLLYPLAFLYKLKPGVEILLFLQAMGLASCGVGMFLLGRQRLGTGHPLLPLLPLLFWAYSPVRAANLFDFHPEVFMLPLFLFGILGMQSDRIEARTAGFLAILAAILAKESAGPVAAGIGTAWLAGAGRHRYLRTAGAVVLGLGIFAFWFDTQWFPGHAGTAYAYANVYEPFGNSLPDLATAPFRHPSEFFLRIFGLSRWKFLFGLLAPFLFLPLLAPRHLIAALPGLLMLFLAAGTQRLSLGFHYAIEPAVGILFALPAALDTRLAEKHQQKLLVLLPLAAIALFGRSEVFHWRFHAVTPHLADVRDRILPAVNPSTSVAATSALVPHVSERRWIHFLPIIEIPGTGTVDCVIWEQEANNAPMSGSDAGRLAEKLRSGYREEFACGSLKVYRRNGSSELCLPKAMECQR